MPSFVHELISHSAQRSPNAIALQIKSSQLSYAQLNQNINVVAQGYLSLFINQGDRVGIYLAKNHENIQSIFACSLLGAVFVPINPVLKVQQVMHIATDCQIKLLITNSARLKGLLPTLHKLPELTAVVVIDANQDELNKHSCITQVKLVSWSDFYTSGEKALNTLEEPTLPITSKETNLAAILYTSGSTGSPKGIMLSHQNVVLGAKSVSQYLSQQADDIILAVLPLSFDYGLNQLTSCFLVGAKCVLLDYLFAKDVIKAIDKYGITGLAAVPPLWIQLSNVAWPERSAKTLRYFTNSGGVLPLSTLASLQASMPEATPFLMYGLTEAFRSTFLSPLEIDKRPTSIGKAIPNAEILVLREDGNECDTNEIGELVHVGPLVSLGYWQNTPATEARFKPTPKQAINVQNTKLAVFSGDFVKRDKEGFLYFISRKDAMIKTSGYRVSPTEIESVLLKYPEIKEAAVIPFPSETLGQEIMAVLVCSSNEVGLLKQDILKHCQLNFPNYMIPKHYKFLTTLPRNANGKIDNQLLIAKYCKAIALS